MAAASDIAVCILAGGASRRFGGNKAFAEWNGQPLIAHILDLVRAQTSGPVAINGAGPDLFSGFDVPVLADEAWVNAGPLAGIRTALLWAQRQGVDEVVTLGVDLPFLPSTYVSKLQTAGVPVIAGSNGRWHPVNGLWAVAQLAELEGYLESGRRSAHGWAELCKASVADFLPEADDIDPFFNVNTAEDLKAAHDMQGRIDQPSRL